VAVENWAAGQPHAAASVRLGHLLWCLTLYFFDEEGAAQEAVSPELAVALQDEDLRAVTLRAAGLSERALRAIREMVESARVIEGPDSGGRMSRRDS
jgi:hypothetical protein